MKLSTKMLLGTALLAITPILVTSLLVGGGAVQLSRDSLTQAVQGQLTSLREVRKQQLTDYFNQLANSLRVLSSNAVVLEGYKGLRQAYANPTDLPKPDVLKQQKEELKGAYLKDFAAEFQKRNPQAATGLEAVIDKLEPVQIALQHAFISANPNPLGAKNKMVEPTERSAFGALHARMHPSVEAFRDKLGFYDIFMIDTQTDRIIYTSFKELDFTTSLADGPSAKTGLGDVYRQVKASGKADTVAMSDYAPYFISYNDQAAFMALPIMEGEKMVGVLAAQLPLDLVSSIMTASRKWKSQGLGDSGETYLVGSDLLMRTDSRFLLEEKAGFLKEFSGKLSPQQLTMADKKGTSIGLVKVDTEAGREAIAGKEGFSLISDYRGTPVFSAYGPLTLYGTKFAVLAELDEAEALAGANEVSRQTLVRTVGIALAMLALAGLGGYFFVRTITKPVNDLSGLVKQVAAGDDEARSTVKTGDELQELGDTFNNLLDERIATLSKATKENESLNDSVVALLQTMFQLSNRDLSARAPVSADIVGTVSDSVNMLASSTSTALTYVKTVANQVALSSERVNTSARNMSEQAQRDREAVTEMTNDIAQASGLMQQVAGLAEQSRQTASDARATTQSALNAVTTTVSEMTGIRESIGEMEKRVKRLGERSQEISQIVAVINSISERTHVLALNASMQAAMAGEAGRGFAVVTEEVQRLADASRNATMQIAQLAQNIQMETSETVAALNRTVTEVVQGSKTAESSGAQMRETEAATSRLAQAVQRIADESQRQLDLARRLAASASTISQSTEQADRNVKSANDDAAALSEASRRLVEVVSEFKLTEEAA